MVDLPPPVDELNEYGKFAFLNEMYTMASQISSNISDPTLNSYLKFALEALESERTNLRDVFSQPYQRPNAKNVIALILRCSELYLQEGQWFNICNAEMHLIDKGNEPFFDQIRTCFQDTGFTDRFVMEIPIIELTFARFKMMNYFEEMRNAYYKGPDINAHDPLSKFIIPQKPVPTDAELYNDSQILKEFHSPDDIFMTDEEYLQTREEFAWAAFRSFQVVGSLFVLIWYSILVGFSVKSMMSEYQSKALFTTSLAAGYGIAMLACELLSFRICFFGCCRPKCHICCIYPGIAMYFLQYGASWVAGIIMILSLFLYHKSSSDVINVMILQHMLAVIMPIFFQPCFFKWHRRVERKFKWIRVGFFKSCGWIFVQIVFCLLFTPGINGVQFIISTVLKNRHIISTTWQKKKKVLTV